MAVPLALFGIGSIAILVIYFIGLWLDKPYIELIAGGYGFTFALAIIIDGTLCINYAYSGGFQCNSVAIGNYALIPTFFTLIAFATIITQGVGYYKKK